MNRKLLIAVISWTWSCHLMASGAISLTIGESRPLRLPSMEVQLSRKGVVDLFHQQDGDWILTGLKRGFVLLTSGGQQWKISVIDHQVEAEPQRDDFCSWQGVSCQRERMVVSGPIDDTAQYFKLSETCRARNQCHFEASLSDKASADIKELLERATSWRIRADRRVEVTRYCRKDESIEWPPWLPIVEICLRPQFRARFRIEAETSRDGHRIGIDHPSRGKGFWITTSPAGDLRLIDHQVTSEDQWQANPELLLLAGQTAKLHSGGELPIHAPDTGTTWKPFGLQIDLTLHPNKSELEIDYHVGLSNRAGADAIAGSAVSSSVSIPIDREVHLASLPLAAASHSSDGSFLLHKIPLLGPWFQGWSRQEDKRTMRVFLQISKADNASN